MSARLRWVARIATALVIALDVMALAGWLLGVPSLPHVHPALAAMTTTFVILIWRIAAAMNHADRRRRAAELEVRDREAHLAITLDSIGDAVITTDEAGRITRMNNVAERLTGWPSAAGLGQKLSEVFKIIDEDTGDPVEDPVERVLRDGVIGGFAKRTVLVARDGTSRAIADRGAPIRNADGEIHGAVMVFHDQSEARVAEYRLRDSEARKAAILADLMRSNDRLRVLAGVSDAFAKVATSYQDLLDQIARTIADLVGDGCLVALLSQDDGRLVSAAHAHRDPALDLELKQNLTGVAVATATSTSMTATVARTGEPVRLDVMPDEVIARSDDALKPYLTRPGLHSFAAVAIRARQTVIGTLTLLRNTGGRSYTDDDVTLIQDLADRAGLAIENARLYAQLEDRVRERTKELETANRELEAFSYSVAHDLRSPLRGIAGFSRTMIEDYASQLPPEGIKQLNRIEAGAQRMGLLIDDLLDLSRVSRVEIFRRQIDLSEMARAVLARLQIAQPGRDVEIAIEPGLVAYADPRLVDIVLTNLLGNAWKFTSKRAQARIELRACVGPGPTTYAIRDNGAGFDPKYASKLFGVFERLHPISEFDGTGIGLAIAQRIIDRHGGRIWARGVVDEGATLFFTLDSRPRRETQQ